MEDSTLQSTIRNGAKRSQASESGTLFSLNVGRASLLRVHYHLKWVGHHFYCQIMWAQILLDCGSWRLSLRAATPTHTTIIPRQGTVFQKMCRTCLNYDYLKGILHNCFFTQPLRYAKKNYPRNIKYMPMVIIFACLDLGGKT